MGEYSPDEDEPSSEDELRDIGRAGEQGYFDKSLGIRILIAVCLGAVLFLFLHFREIRVEVFEINGVASHYVITPVDFQFLDEEATLLLKQEAARGIGKIYKLKEQEIRERGDAFERYLITDRGWGNLPDHTTLEEMYQAVHLLEETLIQSRYTDARTLQKIRELQQPTVNYQLFNPPGEGNETIQIPSPLWNNLSELAFANHNVQRSTAALILNFFRQEDWSFEEDIATERMLQKRAQSLIPDKYTHVSSGSRIVEQGQKITGRHIAMLEAMRKALSESRELWSLSSVGGSLLLTLLIVLTCGLYLRHYHIDTFYSNRRLALYATIVILSLALAKATEYFLLQGSSRLLELARFPLIAPFVAILLCSLMNARLAIFTSFFLALLLSVALAVERSGFLLLNILTAMVCILSAHSLHKRKSVFLVCLKAWLISLLIVFSLDLYEDGNDLAHLRADLLSTFLFMGFTGVLVVGFLPLLESTFHVMTDITLMEYLDPTNDLLRRLSIEAPGTYQHSIVVGNMSEAAALSIGANGLFCRVATQYHDIGKLVAPQYFTENQQGGVNMHQLLTPVESAQVIISHVSEGVSMARKAGLPEQFIDIIKEHHGTTLVYFFFHKQLELAGGDTSKVDERDFRYSGPKPRSKESAIIMIADTLEAASRSLEEFTEENITRLVEKLVGEKAEDGQFDECLLTFEELGVVKRTIVKFLMAASHSRIKYPPKLKI